MKKIIILWIVVLLLIPSGLALDCLEGIDNVCVPECSEVDADCLDFYDPSYFSLEYEDQAKQQLYEERLEELGAPAPLQQEVQQTYTEEPEIVVVEGFDVDTSQEETLFWSTNTIFLLLGAILFIVFILFVFRRVLHSERAYRQQKRVLQEYIMNLQDQGYSQEQIKDLFKRRGYQTRFIKHIFNSLELRP